MSKFANVLKKKIADFQAVKGKVARIGVIKQQHYSDGMPVAYVAAIHEYGSPENHIPARPFFRPTISEKKEEWGKTMAGLLKQGKKAERALKLVGSAAAADVKIAISELDSPPLAQSTKIARNRRAHKPYITKSGRLRKPKPKLISIKPLVDTGLLLESITSDVVDKEGEQ